MMQTLFFVFRFRHVRGDRGSFSVESPLLQSMEFPQLQFLHEVIDVPGLQVVQVLPGRGIFLELTSGFVPFLCYAWFDSGYIVRLSTRRSRRLRSTRNWDFFLGDHFWIYSHMWRYLVRQWMHVGVSL